MSRAFSIAYTMSFFKTSGFESLCLNKKMGSSMKFSFRITKFRREGGIFLTIKKLFF